MRAEDITKRALLFGAVGGAAALAAFPALAANNVGPLMPKNNLADVDDPIASYINLISTGALPSTPAGAGILPTLNGGLIWVASRTALAALDVTKSTVAFFDGSVWIFTAGNFTTLTTNDPTEGIYKASGSVAVSSGCWVRQVVIDILDSWFQTVGNGVADDLLPLTGLVNFCKANPGKIARLRSGLTYGISAPLPTINTSGFKMVGPDVGLYNQEAGPIIKAIGSFSGDILSIIPDIHTNTLSGIELNGFTLHGNAGKASHGLMALSFVESVINLTAIDCALYGGYFACVSYALATAVDTQRNRIRFKSQNRVVDAPGAYFGGGAGGTVPGDFSVNEVEMLELINQIGTAIPLIVEETDSNNWRSISTWAGGTYGAEFRGSNTVGINSPNNEIFHDYVSNKAMHIAAGSHSSPYYIVLEYPNFANGTPATVADIGTGYIDPVWRPYTPTLSYETPGAQVFASTSALWRRISATEIEVTVTYIVTTAGTGRVTVNMPMVAVAPGSGHGTSVNAKKQLNIYVPSGSSTGYMNLADGTDIPNGAVIEASFTVTVSYAGVSLL